MDKAGSLIQRLQEQYYSKAGTNSLLATAQLLIQELKEQQHSFVDIKPETVSVILPEVNFIIREPAKEAIITLQAEEPKLPPQPQQEVQLQPLEQPQVIEAEVKPAEDPKPAEIVAPKQTPAIAPFLNVPRIDEIPTFTYQQKEANEVNDAVGMREESLNDRLKMDKKELASMLKESPVKDLRKAIGINDRFTFINELFRGDEDMYERSIKTINSFNILPEAEYWIQRELKIKIGWNEDSETVQHFDQLVRRRFA